LFERKRTKKKQTNVPFDRLCAWRQYTESPLALRETQSVSLDERCFAARGFLETHIVWKPCLTAIVHRQDFSSPKNLFHPHRLRMKSRTSVR